MKPSLTMFNNNDTFENFFLFGCYKTSFVNHTKKLFFWNHNQVVFTTSMTSSPSSSSINTLVTHHLITHHNNVGNYFNFICMKHTLTMLTLSKTFFFRWRYKNFFIHDHQQLPKTFHSWSSTTTSSSSTKNFFIHHHQQQLHHQQLPKTFSSIIIINNNFIIINKKLFIHHHPCQVQTFSLVGPTTWSTQSS